jgi:bifunctional non-homologous end joining protein LigD
MDPPVDDGRVRVPLGVRPMRATPGDLPEDEGWAYERCWSGLRAVVTDDTGRVRITDPDGVDLSLRFPEIRRIARAVGHLEVILDGVIVPIDADGEPRDDRVGLDRRLQIGSDSGARNAARTAPMVFMALDILWVEGRPVTAEPWELRRRQLDDLRLEGPGWRTSPRLTLADIVGLDAGVVAKRLDSRYRIGESTQDWIEVDTR